MESKDKREGWLREVKVGDKIAVEYGQYGTGNYRIDKVDKITPTGRIVIENRTYDPEGQEMGKSNSYSRSYKLYPITQKVIDFIRTEKLLYEIKNTNWNTLNLEQLEAISKILQK